MALRFPSDEKTYKGQIKFTTNPGKGKNANAETCTLYMPIGIQIADKVEYENAGLGAIGGALAGNGAEKINFSESDLGDTASLGVSQLVSLFSERGGQVVRARNKLAPNPNTRALFKQVNLRSFAFTFKMIPESPKDALNIPEIIKWFRTEMYPEDVAIGGFGDAGGTAIAGYRFPKTFNIELFHEGWTPPKIDECYLESFQTNFNPTNSAFLSQDGKGGLPSEIDISMTFTEAKTLSRKQIEEGF